MRVGVLGIPKDGVGEPNKADHIADGRRERGSDRHFSGDIINPKFLPILRKGKRQLHKATRG